MSTPPPIGDVLSALAEVMRSTQTRWYVFGAQAVLVWGRPRMTADLDVTAALSLQDFRSFLPPMHEAGFRLRVEDEGLDGMVQRTRVLPFVHAATGIPVDVVIAGRGLEERFLERSVELDVGGVRAPIISAEDLIAGKILASREKDLEDVRGILRTRRRQLDLAYIRETLSTIEAALGRSDLTPVLDAEMARLPIGERDSG